MEKYKLYGWSLGSWKRYTIVKIHKRFCTSNKKDWILFWRLYRIWISSIKSGKVKCLTSTNRDLLFLPNKKKSKGSRAAGIGPTINLYQTPYPCLLLVFLMPIRALSPFMPCDFPFTKKANFFQHTLSTVLLCVLKFYSICGGGKQDRAEIGMEVGSR